MPAEGCRSTASLRLRRAYGLYSRFTEYFMLASAEREGSRCRWRFDVLLLARDGYGYFIIGVGFIRLHMSSGDAADFLSELTVTQFSTASFSFNSSLPCQPVFGPTPILPTVFRFTTHGLYFYLAVDDFVILQAACVRSRPAHVTSPARKIIAHSPKF